jgi:hypothetical protein
LFSALDFSRFFDWGGKSLKRLFVPAVRRDAQQPASCDIVPRAQRSEINVAVAIAIARGELLNAGTAAALTLNFLVAAFDQTLAFAILAGLLFVFGHGGILLA